MAGTRKIKSGILGNRTAMPRLEENELGYRRDEKALYIGTSNGNVKLGAKDYEDRIEALETKIAELEASVKNT
jgi:hypothetical protein